MYFAPSSRFDVWMLKVLLFSLADGDGKLYDAYVVYPRGQGDTLSEAVETFVLKTLPQVLEEYYGYRLFILGRDSLPGQGKNRKGLQQTRVLLGKIFRGNDCLIYSNNNTEIFILFSRNTGIKY